MAVLSFISGSFCDGDSVVAKVCRELGYELIDEQLYRATAERLRISEDKLHRNLAGSGTFLGGGEKDRIKAYAALEATLAELIGKDNVVITGCPAYLIPGSIAHAIRICVIADYAHRLDKAKESGMSESDAERALREYDSQMNDCANYLTESGAYAQSHFDIVIPVDKTSSDEAVALILKQVQSDAVRTTEWSRAAVTDFLLSARVKDLLVQDGHKVEVFSDNGNVTIGINEHAMRMHSLEEKLKRKALTVDGVSDVTTKLGSRYKTESANPWENMKVPKVLLVDDEREFVQTLSTRLKTRNLESAIAYDGEEALDRIEKEIPDVIVLDLRMPGIDGIETLRRVKSSHPDIEVIILTGHGTDKEQNLAEELGAFAYLRKPVNVNDLARVMREAYAHKARSDE